MVRMKHIFIIGGMLFVVLSCSFETKIDIGSVSDEMPRLIVGITVDQMRADYLHRFSPHFSDGGFARLVDGGFTMYDHQYGYAPTYTGPGHASIFTGTTPSVNGIVANNWYVREDGVTVYCAAEL